MPQPSATWNSRTVYITYMNFVTGTLAAGTWTAKTNTRITNTLSDGTHIVFRPGTFGSGNLNTTAGQPSLQFDLPVVDDPDNLPQGGVITLTVSFTAGGSETFNLAPLLSWPTGVYPTGGTDLALILDPTIVAGAPPVTMIGVPNGVAGLDSDGDVVDAAGTKVISGGGGGTLTDGSVTTVKMADNAVTTIKITNLNVTTAKIADAAITTVKIADANVTTAKLVDLNVTGVKIADNAITNAKLADDAVNTAEIVNLAVVSSKLADNSVATAKIADGAITSAKIADGSIINADINTSAAIALSKTAGTLPTVSAPLGSRITALWDPITSKWRDKAATELTARVTGRSDICFDFIGGKETDEPAWAAEGDTHFATLTP